MKWGFIYFATSYLRIRDTYLVGIDAVLNINERLLDVGRYFCQFANGNFIKIKITIHIHGIIVLVSWFYPLVHVIKISIAVIYLLIRLSK